MKCVVNVRSINSPGAHGEEQACDYLIKRGYSIVARNVRQKGGEIDIIAATCDTLVFFEVKKRSSSRFGYPEESVSRVKKQRIARAARGYLQKQRLSPGTYIRFDIIAIEQSGCDSVPIITHIQNIDLGEEVF